MNASMMKAPRHGEVRKCGGVVKSPEYAGVGAPVGISACDGCNVARAMDAVGVCTGMACKTAG